MILFYFGFLGVTHLTNTTYKSDLIIITWDLASSPYCGEVLYYQVGITSDEHTDLKNNTVATAGLSTTFLDLKSNTRYTITVAAVNRAGTAINANIVVQTAAEKVSTGSNSDMQACVTSTGICMDKSQSKGSLC